MQTQPYSFHKSTDLFDFTFSLHNRIQANRLLSPEDSKNKQTNKQTNKKANKKKTKQNQKTKQNKTKTKTAFQRLTIIDLHKSARNTILKKKMAPKLFCNSTLQINK